MNFFGQEGVLDFVLMPEISEAAFMDNLLKRYKANYLYVRVFFFFLISCLTSFFFRLILGK